ncbi:MAG: DUF3299 domain-containing protein [Oleiphilaceae bacterium]|nr:DUF3299 domain-containing protein [Oleiphilaceae bacterium]
MKVSICLSCLLGLLMSAHLVASEAQEVEWIDLMPEEDIEFIQNMPEIGHDGNDPVSLPEELMTGNVVEAMDQRNIRIPGFVVPLEFSDDKRVTEFFLVPYFGACIHVPPPPPNQIIHIRYPEGIHVDALYEPYWVSGTLKTERISNDVADASYVMTADKVELY